SSFETPAAHAVGVLSFPGRKSHARGNACLFIPLQAFSNQIRLVLIQLQKPRQFPDRKPD
ncbi:hypothetical protein, partial [Burkholderia plantarii]|uniref:hypothetical protein n=1 Tax=Burkholderia plantarii TaxID=41899 RepID=UPI001C0BF048